MILTSTAYRDGEPMPARFAAPGVTGGQGVSVPLEWRDAPAATRSFVLAMIDIHPVANGWVHWLVTDIGPETTALAEGASGSPHMSSMGTELRNTGGAVGYGGPRPPVGSGVHDYVTTVYALDVARLDAGPQASWEQIEHAMRGRVLDSASLVGRFGRF